MATRPIVADTAAAAPAAAGPASRLIYLDNLRIVLIALVVVGHVAASYGAFGDWSYKEGEASPVVFAITALFVAIGQAFLLGLFMMIAAYFTPHSYDRKGAAAFVVDRLKRLGIPLLIFVFVINPINMYLVQAHKGFQGSLRALIAQEGWSDIFSPGPMWFAEALLIFSLAYALWRLLTPRPSGAPENRVQTGAKAPGNAAIAFFALGLGLVTFLVRIKIPVGVMWEPLHLQPAHFAQYIALFAVGIAAYRGNWLAGLSAAQGRLWAWIALVMVLLLPALVISAGALEGELNPAGAGGFNGLALAYAVWEQFMCVAMVITLLAWFRRRFNRQGPVAREMANATYAVYFLHPLIVYLLTLGMSGVQMNLTLKLVLVAPVAVALCFLVAAALRKLPLVRSVL